MIEPVFSRLLVAALLHIVARVSGSRGRCHDVEQHNIRPKFTAEEILLNFRIFSSTLQSFGSRGPCGTVAKMIIILGPNLGPEKYSLILGFFQALLCRVFEAAGVWVARGPVEQ